MKSIILSLSIVLVLSMGISHAVFAQSTSLELTTPTADKISGGDKKGTLALNTQNNTVTGTATMYEPAAEGKVYEGWFEDKGDASGYSLSQGKFDENDTLNINQTMVNPYTYSVFYVTAEPADDPDPNPSSVVVGVELPSPFGQ
ncbi:MAG TPA: hypothetical protein VFC05_09760 [Nitrososphaeraceae archaeon]|jgi:hypothetical protein|nr:hypothetical protein [Nitrososphaeraceae archaeon]